MWRESTSVRRTDIYIILHLNKSCHTHTHAHSTWMEVWESLVRLGNCSTLAKPT